MIIKTVENNNRWLYKEDRESGRIKKDNSKKVIRFIEGFIKQKKRISSIN